mgnify:CR=1 FL=1
MNSNKDISGFRNLSTTGTITDGTASISSGAITGVASIAVDNLRIDGTTIGHSDDTDLLTITDGSIVIGATDDNAAVDINGDLTVGYLIL